MCVPIIYRILQYRQLTLESAPGISWRLQLLYFTFTLIEILIISFLLPVILVFATFTIYVYSRIYYIHVLPKEHVFGLTLKNNMIHRFVFVQYHMGFFHYHRYMYYFADTG